MNTKYNIGDNVELNAIGKIVRITLDLNNNIKYEVQGLTQIPTERFFCMNLQEHEINALPEKATI